ncbi:unnamed protein product [Albugo candida]|uniref:Uncharacterized protein n=1 Tax=Albugo candida TaxID=65357 RepID=A0A024FX23_9STRA|nr:unnamed protein product [Albugo candida]|eukprot:CCI11670.1 unnamed protein product [Albugo candida]
MIGYLRRQQKFIYEMKFKSSYYITVRWSSFGSGNLLISEASRPCDDLSHEKDVPWRPKDEWWLLSIVVDKFLDMIKPTSSSLQGNNLTLGQQIIQLPSLNKDFKGAIGGSQTPNVEIKEDDILLEDARFQSGDLSL